MNDTYPRLLSIESLPRRVLVLATHADDEVLGCGGMLALHARRGDELRVLVLCAAEGSERARESMRAGERLGTKDYRFAAFADGALARESRLSGWIGAALDDYRPELVYLPAPSELHADHRAASRAAIAALGARPVRLHFYGNDRGLAANVLYDTTAVGAAKDAALGCFASQLAAQDLVGKARACDRAWTMCVDQKAVERSEAFVDLPAAAATSYAGRVAALRGLLEQADGSGASDPWAATAVISNWNKRVDVRENLTALRAQTRPFERIVVVDNASSDGSIEMIRNEFPEVHLIVMPHSRYGACETFNIGFANACTPLLAILDDDVVLPPEWLEKSVERLAREPETTAVLSTNVVEPGMPESYRNSPEVQRERYMSTFRGCASLARTEAVHKAGGYDERLFIYGNERDLTCRLLNLGYRVLQFPGVEAFHKTPFGMKMGKRSLYYHARNAWLGMLKYAPLGDLLRMPLLVFSKVVLRSHKVERTGEVADAVGTIGLGRALRETPGAWWVLVKAAASVLYNIPYCLARREPVRASDFELPIS